MQLGGTMLDSALLCIGFLTKGGAGTLPWFAMACLAMLLHFLCMLSLVALSPVCEKLRWRQLCLACFQTSAGKAGHPWQEPNRSYVKLWICYATTEFINPQIDRRKPYYIPSSLSLVGHGWLEKGTVYLSSIELPNCFRIVCLRLDGHHASRAGGNGAAVLGQLLEEARVSFWGPNLWSPFWYSDSKP